MGDVQVQLLCDETAKLDAYVIFFWIFTLRYDRGTTVLWCSFFREHTTLLRFIAMLLR